MALNISSFIAPADFDRSFTGLKEHVTAPPFREGVDAVLVPGQPERERRSRLLASGIDLDDETWRQITEAAESVGVAAMAL